MQRTSFIPAGAAVFAILAGVAAAPPSKAAVPLTAASSASAFNLSLNIDGQKQTLGNQLYAFGSAPPSYKVRTATPSYSKNYNAAAGSGAVLSGGSVADTASSAGPSGGLITSSATSSAGTFTASINTPLGALLTIHSTGMVSHAGFTGSRSGAGTPSGNANFGKLVIDGPLLGINHKSFSGSPKPNQVLYQSPDKSVTVTLNRQTTTMAGKNPTSITVDALAIEFQNKAVSQFSFSGEMVMGTTMAN